MIKECPVLLNNEYVTVAKYENAEVQFPSIHKEAKTVFVEYVDGKYSIVEKSEPVVEPEEKEVIIKKPLKKIVKAEPSVEESVEKEVVPENDIIADTE